MYETPVAEIIELDADDVLRTSDNRTPPVEL